MLSRKPPPRGVSSLLTWDRSSSMRALARLSASSMTSCALPTARDLRPAAQDSSAIAATTDRCEGM